VNGRVYSGSDGSDRLHAMPGGQLLSHGRSDMTAFRERIDAARHI